MKSWGPVLEVWEGYAADLEVRYAGSSGGLASAIALYCIEQEAMHGLLHIGADKKAPLENETVLSVSRDEIVARTGSRYAPASPCDGLSMVAAAPAPCAFIGKPCDVTGVTLASSLKGELVEKIGVTIGIFCAGTPSSQGTLDLLEKEGIDPQTVEEARYRGKGWPGKFSVKIKEEQMPLEVMTYRDSWGFLQKYRPYRCHLCPDSTSEFADIACGDPWYRPVKEGELGQSIAVVRTERGKEILKGAMEKGYVILKKTDPSILEKSQREILQKRGAVWGRILTMKMFGIPTPKLLGFSLFQNWLKLTFKEQIRSIVGTFRRILVRKYYMRRRTNFTNTIFETHRKT
ncbi:Coenzyme F420 hydrogenase/dehydrogenase, beta subunit C-terminal domain [Nitrospira sp. BLG_1]|uniref:Coenzyme F420 hydrogenase/dehydrogenase, beta subunit C-terminal domain n=1 Tax=Nitrospira sp. BLG_1 TaxID=3395883 RepID=UPI0039BCF8AA